VEDYARQSRAHVLRLQKELRKALEQGWRPDETMIQLRALKRGGPGASAAGATFRTDEGKWDHLYEDHQVRARWDNPSGLDKWKIDPEVSEESGKEQDITSPAEEEVREAYQQKLCEKSDFLREHLRQRSAGRREEWLKSESKVRASLGATTGTTEYVASASEEEVEVVEEEDKPPKRSREEQGGTASPRTVKPRHQTKEEEQMDRDVEANVLHPDDLPLDIKWRKTHEERKRASRRNDQLPIEMGETTHLVVSVRRMKSKAPGKIADGSVIQVMKNGTLHMAERVLGLNVPGKQPLMIVKPGNTTACGFVLGKDIKLYEHRQVKWPDLDEGGAEFEKVCGRPGCKFRLSPLATHLAPKKKKAQEEEERLSSESSSSSSSSASSSEQD
jgi:hypothetical protein